MKKQFPSRPWRSALLLVSAVVIALPIMAGAKNSGKKVTGSVTTASIATTSVGPVTTADIAMNITAGFSASVEQTDLEQSAFTYANADGLAYAVEVRFTNFSGDAVWFTGPIMTASDVALIGQWMVAKVQDNGQSGHTPDVVAIRVVDTAVAAFNMVVAKNQYLFDQYQTTSGNLMIR